MQPAGQDPGVTIGARNGHTTAPFADECQSFLDNVIAGAPGDRQGVRVKVPNDERVANDIGPESCAAAREGRREALTGVRSGWPLSRESKLQSADAVSKAEGHMDGGVSASLRPALRGLRPQHGRMLPAREPGYLACRSGTFAWPAGGRP
jgi:hypothetical protein